MLWKTQIRNPVHHIMSFQKIVDCQNKDNSRFTYQRPHFSFKNIREHNLGEFGVMEMST